MIDVEHRAGVLWLTLDAPERGNTVDYPALEQLLDALETARPRSAVRAVCLRGRGADFCLGDRGDDMGPWPARFADRRHEGRDAESHVVQQAVVSALWRLELPSVAVLTGRTTGFGFDLACAADVRIAASDAAVGDGRILAGDFAGDGTSYLLPRMIGLSQANRLLLLGESLDAAEALRVGLVQDVVAPDALDAHVVDVLDRLAAMATRSYGLIKRQLHEQLDLPYDIALLHSLALRQTHVIEDLAEGMHAFREKRPPRFTGR